MTLLWLLIILALTAVILLRDHKARDLTAQRDELAAENDDLRSDLRVARADLAHARQENERHRAAEGRTLPAAPWPGEPLRVDLGATDPAPDVIAAQAEREAWAAKQVAKKRKPRAVKAVTK